MGRSNTFCNIKHTSGMSTFKGMLGEKKTLKSLSWVNHINPKVGCNQLCYWSLESLPTAVSLNLLSAFLRSLFGGSEYLDCMYPTRSLPNVRINILSRVSRNSCNSQPCRSLSWLGIMVGWAIGAKGPSTRRHINRDSRLNLWNNPLHQGMTWFGRKAGGARGVGGIP